MKTTLFRLFDPKWEKNSDPFNDQGKATYLVPSLSAYAILKSEIRMNDPLGIDQDKGRVISHEIDGDYVVVQNLSGAMFSHDDRRGVLVVYHLGVKDYSLLFKHVGDEELRKRIGNYAKEAEAAMDSDSWTSFMVMVGAVLEGVLFDKVGKDPKNNFATLIEWAEEKNLVNAAEVAMLNLVRKARNRVHAAKLEEEPVSRAEAMELAVFYQGFLSRKW